MIEDGVMENPHVDAMIALHTGIVGARGSKSGDLSYHPIASSFEITQFYVWVKGKSSHVASLHKGIDPLLASCYMITELQALLSRETCPGEAVIFSVNVIKGGTRNNIVPDEVYFEGTLRTMSSNLTDYYYKRLVSVSEHVAESMRCKAEIGKVVHMGAAVNHPEMTKILLKTAPEIVGDEHIFRIDRLEPAGRRFCIICRKGSICIFLFKRGSW